MPNAGVSAAGSPATFGDLLVGRRRAARLTQEELAARSGLSVRAISDMERGRALGPQRRTVAALTEALELDPAAARELESAAKAGRHRTTALPDAALGGAANLRGTSARRSASTPRNPSAQQPDAPANGLPTNRTRTNETPAPEKPGHQQAATQQPLEGRFRCDLPPEVGDLTERDAELDRLRRLAAATAAETHRGATVVVLFGAPGVGKTTLAVRAGHELAEEFPDARFFVNMRGMDAERLTPGQALGRLLLALGVEQARIPDDTDDRAGLYRSLLQERRVLLVLDNVGDEAQIRPLLPSGPGCMVLLTSRRVLSGLESVHRLLLDVLSPSGAVELLESIIGSERVAAEPAATARVAQLSGCLPLALRIAGNRLAGRPRWSVGYLVSALSDQRRRLTALTAGDLQVRAAFEVSYQQCHASVRQVFRRLSLLSGPEFDVDQASVVAETDPDVVEAVLEELVDASLLGTAPIGDRYVLHDLLRLFAGERLAEEEAPGTVERLSGLVTGWFLHSGILAGGFFVPAGFDGHPAPPPPQPVAAIHSLDQARHWLDAEQANWLAALRQATEAGRHAEVLALCRALHWYSDVRAESGLWQEVFARGVAAARALRSRADEAVQLNYLGWALNRAAGRQGQAYAVHQEALRASRDVGDEREEAWSLQYCGRTRLGSGEPTAAVEYFESAMELFRRVDYRLGEHITASFLGLALRRLDRLPEAVRLLHEVTEYFRETSDGTRDNALAVSLMRLGETLEFARLFSEAHEAFREAEALSVRLDVPLQAAEAAFGCGRTAEELGEPAAAHRHLVTAAAGFAAVNDDPGRNRVLRRIVMLIETAGPAAGRTARQETLALLDGVDGQTAAELAALISGHRRRAAAHRPVDEETAS
ncbi:transcriptional regulator with XRE-family HTH domain/tetratricopeptide (TPR) repeat protein [Actinoalloteichus hoggarensis]|uniref:Regulatory protein AfsR n=1 Tax=Actinoalloteichus hoggarensis TaxID=1470176 RepID=A0A221W5Y4_9PSEU|nr:XRE family transcriptional regulator [Actinoalloteichus hoggarensis]ASO21330.1 Regulatory protein AfsR [Actinoalloteichus hoggarensis]MBB5921263.1 transcriptional regulator with XRE-family HTH domain/tetratricopeptide (TPR) repeat protein [Actinoalloteichus hoggarensis]